MCPHTQRCEEQLRRRKCPVSPRLPYSRVSGALYSYSGDAQQSLKWLPDPGFKTVNDVSTPAVTKASDRFDVWRVSDGQRVELRKCSCFLTPLANETLFELRARQITTRIAFREILVQGYRRDAAEFLPADWLHPEAKCHTGNEVHCRVHSFLAEFLVLTQQEARWAILASWNYCWSNIEVLSLGKQWNPNKKNGNKM